MIRIAVSGNEPGGSGLRGEDGVGAGSERLDLLRQCVEHFALHERQLVLNEERDGRRFGHPVEVANNLEIQRAFTGADTQ